jgi:hypothetical protein
MSCPRLPLVSMQPDQGRKVSAQLRLRQVYLGSGRYRERGSATCETDMPTATPCFSPGRGSRM